MKPCVIFNPAAGSASDSDAILKRLESLNPASVDITQKIGEAATFARKALRSNCSYIIAAGGDGTLNEVINGIARHARDVCIGLLPLGTGNDFARSLKLPITVDENIEILRAKKTRAVDL